MLTGERNGLRCCLWASQLVGPLELAVVPDDRGVLGRGFEEEAVRVGLEDDVSVSAADLVFVKRALADAGNENLPDARGAEGAHLVEAPVPAVEAADDADALGVGGPHGEAGSRHAVQDAELRAELFVNPPLVAFAEEV